MPWTFKEILAWQRLCYCFEVFFLFEILLRTIDMEVWKDSSLGLRFFKKFLADLKMSSGLLKFFVLVWFCIFCLPNIFQKVLEHFSHSSYHLILAQLFAPFHCLRVPLCNVSCKFTIIGLNYGLKFSCKVLSLYLSQKVLNFSCKVQLLEKNGTCFLVQDFVIPTSHFWRRGYFSHFKLKK